MKHSPTTKAITLKNLLSPMHHKNNKKISPAAVVPMSVKKPIAEEKVAVVSHPQNASTPSSQNSQHGASVPRTPVKKLPIITEDKAAPSKLAVPVASPETRPQKLKHAHSRGSVGGNRRSLVLQNESLSAKQRRQIKRCLFLDAVTSAGIDPWTHQPIRNKKSPRNSMRQSQGRSTGKE